MVELADIIRQFGAAYREEHNGHIPYEHEQVMRDIEHCRTEVLGGQVYQCPACDEMVYSYHSCRNRHCPKCQHDAGQEWLLKQQELLLPVPYFMLTFTLPDSLRQLARNHSKCIYDLLFRTAAEATQELARDERFVGAQIGLVGVLQTWTRDLLYHPHVHFLTPGGGLSADGIEWRPTPNHFFVHVKPLSRLFRAKFRDGLRKTPLFDQVPTQVWTQEWVVHCQAVGDGHAALKYLAPYIFRVAISNRRILKLEDDQVTFAFKDSKTGQNKTRTLPATAFLHRFLQHTLPKGFVKVRYYGFFAPTNRHRLRLARQRLGDSQPLLTPSSDAQSDPEVIAPDLQCPKCGRDLHHVRTLLPRKRHPP
jgi:hypothetical protein